MRLSMLNCTHFDNFKPHVLGLNASIGLTFEAFQAGKSPAMTLSATEINQTVTISLIKKSGIKGGSPSFLGVA